MKIANPKMATPHVNKHVKFMGIPSEKERAEYLLIKQLSEMGG